jgi:recombination protein RecR
MSFSPLIEKLIESIRCLPGVGPKTARRMCFHLLQNDRIIGLKLAKNITEALAKVGHCNYCNTFSENNLCSICSNEKRDKTQICIVENPTDIFVIEQTGIYNGLYFVLMGHLSPIDGIGPDEIGLNKLEEKIKKNNIREIILATSHTVEGEATAYYINQILKKFSNIILTRIAHGIPFGGELEYSDVNTISRALKTRITIE